MLLAGRKQSAALMANSCMAWVACSHREQRSCEQGEHESASNSRQNSTAIPRAHLRSNPHSWSHMLRDVTMPPKNSGPAEKLSFINAQNLVVRLWYVPAVTWFKSAPGPGGNSGGKAECHPGGNHGRSKAGRRFAEASREGRLQASFQKSSKHVFANDSSMGEMPTLACCCDVRS